MGTSAVMFSPHFDDAALSACGRLLRGGCELVTVFSGPPPPGLDTTPWDRLCGALSSHTRYKERIAEDDCALSIIGCSSRRLGEPEFQFRATREPSGEFAAAIDDVCSGCGEIWAPAAIGGHPDHRIVRDAVLACEGVRLGRVALFLYADQPYVIIHGWPGWVNGQRRADYLDVDRWLRDKLEDSGLATGRLAPLVARLSPQVRRQKEAAISCYRSQLPALGLAPGAERWNDVLDYEVMWRYQPAGHE